MFPHRILRHKKENLKKCSLSGLENRDDFEFYRYPRNEFIDLSNYFVLSLGAPLLTKEDSGILEDINSDNYFIQEYERVRFFHLLSNNFIIEYHDDNSSWYAVHPIIKLILDQNKKEETFIA